MKKHNAGFTWLELIPVLIILGIIAVIVYPVFFKLREGHTHNSCLSNLKQLGLALQQYTQDYDNQMPGYQFHPRHSPTNTVNGTGWLGQTYPYIKSAGMLKCPSDDNTVKTGPSGTAYVPISYAINSNAITNPLVSTYSIPVRTVLVFEVAHVNANVTEINEDRSHGAAQVSAAGNGVNGRLSSSLGELPTTTDPARYATGEFDNSAMSTTLDQYSGQEPRHSGGSNFLLVDGHAKWFRPSAVSAGGNALKQGNPQSSTGCAVDGSKHPGAYPCAAGADDNATPPHGATFSVN